MGGIGGVRQCRLEENIQSNEPLGLIINVTFTLLNVTRRSEYQGLGNVGKCAPVPRSYRSHCRIHYVTKNIEAARCYLVGTRAVTFYLKFKHIFKRGGWRSYLYCNSLFKFKIFRLRV